VGQEFKGAPGPYSVHTYSEIQTRKTVTGQGGRTWDCAAISIGAGNKMLGEVRYHSEPAGYPCIDSEDEMRAVAALWIAAPDLLKAAQKALNFIENTEGEMGESLDSGDALRAAITRALGEPMSGETGK